MRLPLFFLFSFVLIFSYPDAAATENTLSFSEDFTGVDIHFSGGLSKKYPDPLKWAFTFQPGILWPDSYGDGTNWLANNDECQTYVTPLLSKIRNGSTIPPHLRYDPFDIKDDGLHITADLLTAEQQKLYHVGEYRRFGSGILLSRFAFQYGKLRVVAKLPNARGSWPALWLLADKMQWPPEIDVFEAMAWGKHQQQIRIGLGDNTTSYGEWHDVGVDLSADFHEYGMDWNKDTITILFDGRPIVTRPTPPSMHQPMVIILNLAVGGKWVYNELGIKPTDSRDAERLNRGSDLIQADYPAEMIVKSLTVAPAS